MLDIESLVHYHLSEVLDMTLNLTIDRLDHNQCGIADGDTSAGLQMVPPHENAGAANPSWFYSMICGTSFPDLSISPSGIPTSIGFEWVLFDTHHQNMCTVSTLCELGRYLWMINSGTIIGG